MIQKRAFLGLKRMLKRQLLGKCAELLLQFSLTAVTQAVALGVEGCRVIHFMKMGKFVANHIAHQFFGIIG